MREPQVPAEIIRYQIGLRRSRVELHPDALVVAAPLRGVLEKRIPYDRLRGFCVERMPFGHGGDFDGDLVVAWEDGASKRTARVAVLVDDPALHVLLRELSARCPEASLLTLPIAEALRRIGVRSILADALVLGAVFVVLVGIGVVALMLYARR